jgi:hypothetical protein
MSKLVRETRVRGLDRFELRDGRRLLIVCFEIPYFELHSVLCAGGHVFIEVRAGEFSEISGELPHVDNPSEAFGSLGVSPPPPFEVTVGARVELRYPD